MCLHIQILHQHVLSCEAETNFSFAYRHVAGEYGVREQRDVAMDDASRRAGSRRLRERLGARPVSTALRWHAAGGHAVAPSLSHASYTPQKGHSVWLEEEGRLL